MSIGSLLKPELGNFVQLCSTVNVMMQPQPWVDLVDLVEGRKEAREKERKAKEEMLIFT